MVRLGLTLFLLASGFHGFTASLPIALTVASVPITTIGLIVGSAPFVQLPTALTVGGFLDRFGALRILYGGAVSYLAGSLILLGASLHHSEGALSYFAARICQGLGLAATLPASLSLVPRLVEPGRQGVGLAFVSGAINLAIVTFPPISLVVLERFGLAGVAGGALALTAVGMTSGLSVRAALSEGDRRPWSAVTLASGTADESVGALAVTVAPASRIPGIAFRRRWIGPLLVASLFVVSFGTLTAYLPSHAYREGANVALFFAADGVGILIARIPAGWLTDHAEGIWPQLLGLGSSMVALVAVLQPLSTGLLLTSGALYGAGAAFALTPNLVELSRRSAAADRGSAFAMYAAAMALGQIAGSIGAAPFILSLGLGGVIAIGAFCLLLAATLVIRS